MPRCHQAEMAVGWAHPTTGSNQHHKTGNPKGSAGEAVHPRLGEEAKTLNVAHVESPGAGHAQNTEPYWVENCS